MVPIPRLQPIQELMVLVGHHQAWDQLAHSPSNTQWQQSFQSRHMAKQQLQSPTRAFSLTSAVTLVPNSGTGAVHGHGRNAACFSFPCLPNTLKREPIPSIAVPSPSDQSVSISNLTPAELLLQTQQMGSVVGQAWCPVPHRRAEPL